MTETRRFQDLDIMRVIATAAVIIIHSTSQTMTLSEVGYYGNQLARFAVPMFLILSGFLLFQSDLNSDFLPRAQFYRKRFRRILLPYVIWTIIYSLVLHFYFNGMQNAHMILPDLFRHLLLGNGFTHLYFVVIIIQLYLFYPFFRRQFKAQPGLSLLLSFLISLPCQYQLYVHSIKGLTFAPYQGEISLIAFPVWIFYFCLGMFLAQKDFRLEMSGRLSWPAWLLIWTVSLGILLWDSRQTASYALSIKPTVMLYATCSFFLLRSLLNRCAIQSSRIITWLSDQSFLIYLLHPLMANFLVFISLHFNQPDLWSSNAGTLAKFLLTLILTLILTRIIVQTPLAKPLGGQ
ncbi:MAG TPA: acyltransferase [Syntrophomonadaceae bacterium]|nr:acyltransferase [Syntrophomonadaceae bacterium]